MKRIGTLPWATHWKYIDYQIMKGLLIYIICLMSSAWSIGLDALVIPQKATILAMSGSGIAGDLDIGINPSSSVKPYLGFSSMKNGSRFEVDSTAYLVTIDNGSIGAAKVGQNKTIFLGSNFKEECYYYPEK